jgi:UDP:flavonoid glycosyltransferase YjiC (YdhE family)
MITTFLRCQCVLVAGNLGAPATECHAVAGKFIVRTYNDVREPAPPLDTSRSIPWETYAMRVLFTSSPGWGHIHPMVGLARAFLARGDEVLWVTGADACARLEREGFRTSAAGLGEREGMAELDRQFPEIRTLAPSERPEYMFPRLFGAVRAAAMLDGLMPAAKEWLPTLVVCDAAELAGPIAAAALDVPNVSHAFGALLPPSRVMAAGAQTAPLWAAYGLEPRPYGGCYDHLYLDVYPPSLQPVERPHVPATQYLRPEIFATGADEDLPGWVTTTSSAPLVYVTFGTVFSNDAALATVVEALRELDGRVVVTVGPHGDPASLGSQPDNVHVARYIPQRQLLPHCSLVVSHAGSGTFLAALSSKIPQLCLPQAADQFLNAAAGFASGAALTVEPGSVSVEAVREAAARLLSEASFRTATKRISAEIDAMPAADEVANRLHDQYA